MYGGVFEGGPSEPREEEGRASGRNRRTVKVVVLSWSLPRGLDPAGCFVEPYEMHLRTVHTGDAHAASLKQAPLSVNTFVFLDCL